MSLCTDIWFENPGLYCLALLTFICPNFFSFPAEDVWECSEWICNRLLVSSLAGPAWWIFQIKVWQPGTACSASSVGGHAAQCSVSELGGQYAQHCPSWLTAALPSSLYLHKGKVINQTCLLLPAFPAEEKEEEEVEDEGDLAWWWMPSLLRISKVEFIHEEWRSLYTGWGEIAFFSDLQPRVRKWMESDMRVSALWGDEYGAN